MIAPTSQVDESLFGAPTQARNGRARTAEDKLDIERQADERTSRRKSGGVGQKETVQLVTKDLIRQLMLVLITISHKLYMLFNIDVLNIISQYYFMCSVPDEDPSGQTAILSYADFQRIRNAAQVLSKEERQRAHDETRQKVEDVQVRLIANH